MTAETGGNIKDVLRMAADNPWDNSMMEIIVHLAAVLFSRDKDDLIGPLLALALRPGTTTVSRDYMYAILLISFLFARLVRRQMRLREPFQGKTMHAYPLS